MNEEYLSNLIVVKRSGKKVAFDGTKIAIAIKKGFDSIEGKYNEDDVNKIYNKVIEKIIKLNVQKIKIEDIQDLIEEELKANNYVDVYKSFAEYREKRNQSREIFFEEKRKHKFLKALEKLGLTTKENSSLINNDKNTVEMMEAYGKTVSEEFTTSYLMKKKYSDSHENGDIYINKIENYPMGTTESVQMDLDKLFTDGFSAGNCSMREPQSISSYTMLAVIAISSNQKDQDGETSIPAFDYYMAPGVIKTFKKVFRETIYSLLEYTDYDKFIAINGIEREIDKLSSIDFNIEDFYKFTRNSEELKRMFRICYKKSLEKTNEQTYQAMEGFVHDLNSLAPTKITTINLGTDTSSEGRMVTSNLLRTIEEGIGENKVAISPKVVFKISDGINFNESSKNFDLLKKAVEVAIKTDNISFSFIDSSYNSAFYKEGDYNTEVSYFSDGTRVIDNLVDEDKAVSGGRGVISSTTINLPRIALKNSEKISEFWDELYEEMNLIKDQQLERLEIQNNKKCENFPFLMGESVWLDSEKINGEDKIKRILKQGVLEIKFTGLAETIYLLTNEKMEDSKKAMELAIKIIKTMRKTVDEFSKKSGLTFVLAGNYDEEINQDFLDIDRVIFGKIKNITDKEKYCNAFDISSNNINKKIECESPFFEFTNGGHRFEIEIDKAKISEDIEKEEDKLLKILKDLRKNDIGFAIICK